MNNILILDLTRNRDGFEFVSAERQKLQLEQIGCNVYLEKFDSLTDLLKNLEILEHTARYSQAYYSCQAQVAMSFIENYSHINSIIDQYDYVNIRCHGGLKSDGADLFGLSDCANDTIKSIATFGILLENIPKLRTKDIFFTICHGFCLNDDFIFDGLKISQGHYIASLDIINGYVSNRLLTTYIKLIRNENLSLEQAFDRALNELKAFLYTLSVSEKRQAQVTFDINNQGLWEEYINNSFIGRLCITQPSSFIELS